MKFIMHVKDSLVCFSVIIRGGAVLSSNIIQTYTTFVGNCFNSTKFNYQLVGLIKQLLSHWGPQLIDISTSCFSGHLELCLVR